ncbi:MAG: hypothetical protein WC302_03310 [Candidatus Paceibacterota bacterium]|jgi:hypothetical protein
MTKTFLDTLHARANELRCISIELNEKAEALNSIGFHELSDFLYDISVSITDARIDITGAYSREIDQQVRERAKGLGDIFHTILTRRTPDTYWAEEEKKREEAKEEKGKKDAN